jgi:cytidylate kinase
LNGEKEMPGKFYQNPAVSGIVERQMRMWELAKESDPVRLAGGVEIDYITISRELGSGGEEIGRILADLMKWCLYDKDVLNYLAEDMNVHKSVLECVDERTTSWIEDWVTPLFKNRTARHVDQLTYYRHLTKVLLVISKLGHVIIIGRAAGLVLPRDRGLSVRVTAPFEVRCERYAEQNKVSHKQAKIAVKKADKEQRQFGRDYLGKDIFDSKHYDIVFNTGKLVPTAVAKLIWRAFDQRIMTEKSQAEK